MEYTKGEWKKEGNKITKFGQGTIAICPSPNTGGVFEFVANAHLIAAAPELYEALDTLYLEYLKLTIVPDEASRKAVKALAKAEGK